MRRTEVFHRFNAPYYDYYQSELFLCNFFSSPFLRTKENCRFPLLQKTNKTGMRNDRLTAILRKDR